MVQSYSFEIWRTIGNSFVSWIPYQYSIVGAPVGSPVYIRLKSQTSTLFDTLVLFRYPTFSRTDPNSNHYGDWPIHWNLFHWPREFYVNGRKFPWLKLLINPKKVEILWLRVENTPVTPLQTVKDRFKFTCNGKFSTLGEEKAVRRGISDPIPVGLYFTLMDTTRRPKTKTSVSNINRVLTCVVVLSDLSFCSETCYFLLVLT